MSAEHSRFEFRLPELGEGIHEAELLAWRVDVGQTVEAFQPLCEVEFAKATVELTSPVAGVVRELRVDAGTTAHLGETLVVIETSASSPSGSSDGPPAPPAEASDWVGIVGAPPGTSFATALPRAAPDQQERPAESHKVFAAPIVRKTARDLGIELADVPGTGPQGRVRLADLEAYAKRTTSPAEAPSDAEVVPLTGIRKRIADHLIQAVRHAPLVSAMDLFDVTELVEARQALAASLEAEGATLSYLPFFVKAVIQALRVVPSTNATVDESTGALTRRSVYHIGIATALADGLIVPVIQHAERLSIAELAVEIGRLVQRARARQLTPAELTGSTFTLTSFGGLPGAPLFATPIVNHPEVAILGLGRVEPQPRVVGGQIVPRQCLGVSFTFDHRFIDGKDAADFLSTLRRHLEHPLQLLLTLR